jgi:transposase
MAKPIEADYQTTWLLPPSLEELVPQNHPSRFLREFVDSLDLQALGFAEQRCEEGRPPYAQGLLLKVWLYGYWNGIRSHRKLEQACREHLSLLWLTGMNAPDHNTLWRFWQAHKKELRALHRQSVHLAMKAGLVSLVLLAVDGTKIEAAASGRSGWTKEYMQKLLEQLDRVLDRTETEIQHNAQEQQGEYRLPESLAERQALRQALAEGLKELEQSGRGHYHRQEPEAHRMKCVSVNRFAYNAQAVADEKNGIILACDVTSQEHDVGQLPFMLKQARDNVQSAPTEDQAQDQKSAEPVSPSPAAKSLVAVADTGYGAAADLALAQAEGFEVVVPLPEGAPSKDKPYHSSHFQYDAQRDVCVCPQKQALVFTGQKNRRGQIVRVYRCRSKDCPVMAQCTREPKGRTIEIGPHHAVVVAMRQTLASPEGQARLKRRASIIEPRFAGVKSRQGFRRWTVRGLEKVKGQWGWLCLTANLQVLFSKWLTGALSWA